MGKEAPIYETNERKGQQGLWKLGIKIRDFWVGNV